MVKDLNLLSLVLLIFQCCEDAITDSCVCEPEIIETAPVSFPSANLFFVKFLNKKLFFNNKKFLITPYTGIIFIEVVMKFVVIHFRVDLFPIGKEMR